MRTHAQNLDPVLQKNEWPVIAKNLSKIYKAGNNKFVAVNDAMFAVKKGTVLGLLGPNGAGKSTTFSILALQANRSEGNCYIDGDDISKIDLAEKGR